MSSSNRDIKTRIVIDGDKAYRDALKEMTTAVKEAESAMKLAQAQFDANSTSQEALTGAQEAAANATEVYNAKIEKLKAALDNAANAQKKYEEQVQQTKDGIQKTGEELDSMGDGARKAGTEWNKLKAEEQNLIQQQEALNNSTEKNKTKQEEVESALAKVRAEMAKLNESTGGTAEKAGQLVAKEDQLTAKMERAEAGVAKCKTTQQQYQTQINNTERQVVQLTKQMDDNTKKMEENADATTEVSDAAQAMNTIFMTLGIKKIVGEISDAFKECVDAAADFQYQMSTVAAVSDATDGQLEALKEQAIEYSTSTVHTASDMAEAYATLARAGWTTEEMLSGMSGIMNLSSAAGESMIGTVSRVADSLTAFGYSASESTRFADALAEASADSNTTVALLGESFKMVATTAGNLGYNIEDVAVALAGMANNGLKGEMAGSALSTALTRMSGANQTAAKEMDRLGLSMYDLNTGAAKPLAEFLGELREKFAEFGQGSQEAQNSAYRLAGQRGMKGLLAIVNSSQEDWDSLTESINNCAGASEKMSTIQLDNYTGEVKLLESAEEALRIEVGNQLTPALGTLTEMFTGAITAVTKFIGSHEAVMPVLTTLATALGVFVVGITAVKVATMAATVAMEAFGSAALLTPVGAVAAAVGLLAGAFIALSNAEKDALSASELLKQIEDQKDAWEENREEINGNAESAQSLMVELNQLASVENKTTAQKNRMIAVVKQLNKTIDGLNISYDEENDRLSMTTESIQQRIDALVNEARAEEVIQEMMEIRQNQIDLEDRLNAAHEERNKQLSEAKRLLESGVYTEADYLYATTDGIEGINGQIDAMNAELEDSAHRMVALENEYADLVPAADEYTETMVEIEDETGNVVEVTQEEAEAMEEAAEACAEADEKMQEIAKSCDEASGSGDELADTYKELQKEYDKLDGKGSEAVKKMLEQKLATLELTATTKQLTEQLPMLGEANAATIAGMLQATDTDLKTWVDAYEKAFANITGSFRAMELNTENTMSEWFKAMDANQDIQEAWNKNTMVMVDHANKMAQDGDSSMREAVDIIMDGGIEEYGTMAQELAEAIESNDQQTIDKITAGIKAAGSAANYAAAVEFARANNLTQEQFMALWNSSAISLQDGKVIIEDEAAAAAAGVTSGLEGETPQAEAAATELIEAVAGAALDADTQTAFENAGKATIQYMVNGIEAKAEDTTTAIDTLLSTAAEGVDTETSAQPIGEKFAMAIHTGMGNKSTSVANKAKSVINAAASAARNTATTQGRTVGAYFDQGVVNGLASGSGSVYSAAYRVGYQAYLGAKAGADEHSPSKRGEEVGLFFDEGVEIGLDDGADLVYDSAERVGSGISDRIKNAASFPNLASSIGTLWDELTGDTNPDNHMWNIVINSQPGQDARAIANQVMDMVNAQVKRVKGAKARA